MFLLTCSSDGYLETILGSQVLGIVITFGRGHEQLTGQVTSSPLC